MSEELASYHIPEGEPKHVPSVNFLARLREAEARLRAAQEQARQEAAAVAKREAAARAAADEAARHQAAAAAKAERQTKHAATAAKVHRIEENVSRKIHPKRIAGTLLAGLLFGGVLISTYELIGRDPVTAPVPVPVEAPSPSLIEVVPNDPTPGPETDPNIVPDRGTPPGLEQQ